VVHSAATDFGYSFLTEADQILQARLSNAFLEQLQQDLVVVPHRLQPIPHPDDLQGVTLPDFRLNMLL